MSAGRSAQPGRLVVLMLSALVPFSAQAAKASPPDTLVVSTSWLADRLDDPNVVIIHTGMSRSEYDAAHVPGARFLDHMAVIGVRDGIQHQLASVDHLVDVLEAVGVSNDSRIIIYGGAQVASRLFYTLDYLGLGGRASILDGGLEKWRQEGRPLSVELPTHARGSITPRTDERLTVNVDWVNERLDDTRYALLDVRSPGEYGDGAGHIPGAVNLPWQEVYQEEDPGILKDAEALRALFAGYGATSEKTVVTYCQIGMRASAVYLAARVAGLDVVMYDGSFLDWSRRSDLPVQR